MPEVIRNIFEEYIKKEFNIRECITCNSGTSALIAVLYSLDLKPDDEIITTPLTFIATSNSVVIAGGRPVFADIKEEDFLIDPVEIEKKITEKTKAIIPVHLYGRCCDMDAIMNIAAKYNLLVIEDTSQSFGKKYNNKRLGTIGDAGTFSFYKTKNISTFEGGMISIPHHSKFDGEKIRSICNQGQVGKYNHEYIGFNFRLAEPLILLAYERIKLHMTGVESELGLRGPEQGHYPEVVYNQPIYKKMGITGSCPVAEKAAEYIKNIS